MGRVTTEVRALLQERQDRSKAKLDAHRRDVLFTEGDEVLLETEHTPLPSRSLLSPRWMGPFKVLATHTDSTSLPRGASAPSSTWSVSAPTSVARTVSEATVVGADGAPEYEVQELLKFKMRYGQPYVLVRWAGCNASGDTWEPLDNLTNCNEVIAAFKQTLGRTLPRPALASPARPAGGAAPAPIAPAGFTVDAAPPGDLGAALVGRTLLYWWPIDGW
jgi:hypothetical protein